MNCDDIAWLVDMLGNMELLSRAIDDAGVVKDVSSRGTERSQFKSGNVPNGLYFDGAHWYAVKNKQVTDSYTEGFQQKGTAHFCQTFAVMIYNGGSALRQNDYANNIKLAAGFWTSFFTANSALVNWFLGEIKSSEYKNETIAGTNTQLQNITKKALLSFLQDVSKNAQQFVNCRQG